MASLKNGVLLKLLEEMETDGGDDDVLKYDPRKPVLLQIRSIIPVLEKGDLWPNRGFFLKVSDSTHALYVSLSEEQNEMILGNKLKLGQFIYVQELKKAHPVPLLKGVIPIPGRRPCEGAPEDIISQADLVKVLEASAFDSIVEKGVILEKRVSKNPSFSRKLTRGLSDSEFSCKKSEGLKSRSLSAAKARPGGVMRGKCGFVMDDTKKFGCSEIGVWPRSRPSSVDNDSDGDSVVSSCSSRMSKRRSWQESEILGVKEIFDSSVVKNEIKLPPRSRSANVSPVRSVRYDSSDDNSSSISRRRSIGSAKRLVKSSNKSQAPVPRMSNVQIGNSLCSLVYERNGAESGILWNSLPANLVKLGKEVTKQRDLALLAAADALQEACASERLLNSLSTLSQIPLVEGDDLQRHAEKFFNLQDDLSHTRLIMQSLTSITPFRTQESSEPTNSVKETLHTALERKKNAITWIKSAVALDLSPSPSPPPPPPPPLDHRPVDQTKKMASSDCGDKKPKNTSCVVKKSRSNADITGPLFLATAKEDQPDWTRGSALDAASELAASLQDECRKMFLSCVEKFLDEVDRKSGFMESEGEMAGMMFKVKMASDWLNVVFNNNNNKEGKDNGVIMCDNLEEYEAEAYERVRNKIYGILLKHVERTATAFERGNGTS